MSRLVDELGRYTKQAQGGVITHEVDTTPGLGPAHVTGAFPRGGLGAADPRDEIMREKYQLGADKGVTPFGNVVATDADFEWLKRKRDTEAFANLDAWIGKNFHTADVATRKWLQETYPEYYEAREKLMIDRAKFALRIKLLKLRGPKNHKDLILQWGLQTGRIQLDKNWDVIGSNENIPTMSVEQDRYAKGLMSPYRYLSDRQRTTNMNFGAGTHSVNPFVTGNASAGGHQIRSPFPGADVSNGKYPTFLSGVINAAMQ